MQIDKNNSFLSKDKMGNLTTKRLLAYKNKLMKYHESPDYDSNNAISKQHPSWQETYKNLKEVLSTREHINKK